MLCIRNIQQIYPFRNLSNALLHFGSTILLKQWTKEKKKNSKKTKQCYNNEIRRWKKDSFSGKVKIRSSNKLIKKLNLKKDLKL